MGMIRQIFSWWNDQTIGTRFFTWKTGEQVGVDDAGNRYFQTRGDSSLKAKRWVIYNGEAEPSRIPPAWHMWLHGLEEAIPANQNYTPREWEQPHQENMTGTAGAYRPDGSILASGQRPAATGDYEAWRP